MKFTPEARAHIQELRHHYRVKQRPEALRNLTRALHELVHLILAGKGIPAPRPYPELAQPERAWVKAGRYWIRYTTTAPTTITAVFYDQADLPGRM